MFDDIALNKGMLTENLVAQMLAAAGRKLYFFSRSDSKDRANRMEIDFLIAKSKLARKNNIHAIEVKSGKNTTHRSLDKFSDKYLDWLDTPYLLWDRDLLIKDGILHLPLLPVTYTATAKIPSSSALIPSLEIFFFMDLIVLSLVLSMYARSPSSTYAWPYLMPR